MKDPTAWMDDLAFVVVLGRHDRPLEAALDSAGAAIIFARSAV
jgi:hypothetical protein